MFSLSACDAIKKIQKPESGYYYQKNTTKNSSLVIPPDLSQPNFEQNDVSNIITNNDKTQIFIEPSGIKVKKRGNRRYLQVDKPSGDLWNLTQDFLRESGFVIKNSQTNIGLIETDYLKRELNVPKEQLNIIRAFFQRTLKATYVKPVIDKFIVRIEPLSASKTEIYLSISTLEEIGAKSGNTESENTEWRLADADIDQEAIMLYRLMTYLGGNIDEIIKPTDTTQEKLIKTELIDTNDYIVLRVYLNKEEAWRYVSWALDRLEVNISDKDKQEGSFYVKLIEATKQQKQGLLSRLFAKIKSAQTFQILVQQINQNFSEVSLKVLSTTDGKHQQFSREFLTNISEQITN